VESALAIKRLRRFVLMLDLKFKRGYSTLPAIIRHPIERLRAETAPAIFLAQKKIGDYAVHPAELEIVVEGQDDGADCLHALINHPDAPERFVVQKFAQRRRDALRIEAPPIVSIIFANQCEQCLEIGCARHPDHNGFRFVGWLDHRSPAWNARPAPVLPHRHAVTLGFERQAPIGAKHSEEPFPLSPG
jgi:hypothetical protein